MGNNHSLYHKSFCELFQTSHGDPWWQHLGITLQMSLADFNSMTWFFYMIRKCCCSNLMNSCT